MSLLFSVTKKDLQMDVFRCPGKGGQNVNKVSSGVRWTHPPSGAVGHSCTHREQHRNKTEAFKRMANSPEFQKWAKAEAARRMGTLVAETPEEILARVDKMIEEGLRDGTISEESY